MIRISRKMYYAVDAVLHIALTQSANRTVSSRALARVQKVSARYMEQTLQQLVRQGILMGTRGPRGGYRLARPPAQITIGEILATVRHGTARTASDVDGSPAGRAVLLPLFDALVRENVERLDRTTLADLMQSARDEMRSCEERGDRRDGDRRSSRRDGAGAEMVIA